MAITRYTAVDVRDKVIDLLKNGGTDCQGNIIPNLSAALTSIDTKRSTTTPKPSDVTYKWGDNQYPFVFVDVGDSETDIDDSPIGNLYDEIAEVYNVNVAIHIKDNEGELFNYVENYIEGFIDVLHGYANTEIEWVELKSTIRPELYMDQNQTFHKLAFASFDIRIN